MFGYSSQDVFSAVCFLRAQVTCTSGKITKQLAFVLGKAPVAPMKVMTVTKLELQAALLAVRLKTKIYRALTFTVDKVFMWTDSSDFPLRLTCKMAQKCSLSIIIFGFLNELNRRPI